MQTSQELREKLRAAQEEARDLELELKIQQQLEERFQAQSNWVKPACYKNVKRFCLKMAPLQEEVRLIDALECIRHLQEHRSKKGWEMISYANRGKCARGEEDLLYALGKLRLESAKRCAQLYTYFLKKAKYLPERLESMVTLSL
jgi:hypothetical protein